MLLSALGIGALAFGVTDGSDNNASDNDATTDDEEIAGDGDDLHDDSDFFEHGFTITEGVISLTNEDDLFSSGSGSDSILGFDGDDTIFGADGEDIIDGGRLYDDLYGGADDDEIKGGRGNDFISGGDGGDHLFGGKNLDGLFGGSGNDVIYGGTNLDFLVGGDHDDRLFGNGGDDALFGGLGADTLYGGEGDDELVASSLTNRDLDTNDYIDARSNGFAVNEDDEELFKDFGFTGTTDTASDTIYGGNGDDAILIGHDDFFEGGGGEDAFILGDWSAAPSLGENLSVINDFDTAEDTIVIAINDDAGESNITYETEGEGYRILVNGRPIAFVFGEFDQLDGIEADVVTTDYSIFGSSPAEATLD